MRVQYFNNSWSDIKNSKGWFSKLLLLTLLYIVPIFGQLVSLGYAYGWAREIAWGIHAPLPKSIFSNQGGKLFIRGFHTLVITVVFLAIPYLLYEVFFFANIDSWVMWLETGDLSEGIPQRAIILVLASVLVLLLRPLVWIGRMRASVYGRLAPGLQLSKIWAMLKHDFGGILRIYGMYYVVPYVINAAFSALVSVALCVVLIFVSLVPGALRLPNSLDFVLFPMYVAIIVLCFALLMTSVFTQLIVARALGYWTRGFNVVEWGGPKESLPFQRPMPAPPQGQPLVIASTPAAQAVSSDTVGQPASSVYPIPQAPVEAAVPQEGTAGAEREPDMQGPQNSELPGQTKSKE